MDQTFYCRSMRPGLETIRIWFDRIAPDGSPRRKVLQILSVIFLIEGASVLVLFSYWGLWLGLLSILTGAVLLFGTYNREAATAVSESPLGIRFLVKAVDMVGGPYVVMSLGGALVALTLSYNLMFSPRPELGDIDTIIILFGGILIAYPFVPAKYSVETAFAILFVGFVVLLLAVPQVVVSFSELQAPSSAGSWYVHYMLAAPFAGILDLIGVPASSSGNQVTIWFQDESMNVLSISSYCAGLYSFSIFLSAFFAFVLVFENLSKRQSYFVLLAGLIIAYLGNLFRMVVIGLVGYYEGIDAMLWAHNNIGWVIFLLWSAIFWWIVLGRVTSHRQLDGKTEAD